MKETVPTNQRIYLTIETKDGDALVNLSLMPPEFDHTQTMAVLLSRGQLPAGPQASMTIPLGSKIEALPDIEVGQLATLAMQAGVRAVTVNVDGIEPGDALIAIPKSELPNGYAVLNTAASAANTVKVSVLAPALAVGASYSIACRLIRLKI